MLGHDASDVLRELVQNEYDGGGDRLRLDFAQSALTVTGNGRGIGRDGWSRLSVIVGIGRVMGEAAGDRIEAKQNGIGSKNFGLRSLFIFGDEIYVRSRGRIALLDLRTQETGNQKDSAWNGAGGVQLHVGFRDAPFEKLELFTVEREHRAFDLMAARMPATLVKLALGGRKPGLREVMVTSVRTRRALEWRQEATAERCRVPGVTVVSRTGRMIDRETGRDDKRESFQEIEFARPVTLPAGHSGRNYPAYYRVDRERIRIAVSLPILRRKVDFARSGHFYYPLQTPDSRTGCAVSVSAPFDLNNDRSSLTDSGWNDWLIDRSVDLIMDLLTEDWLERYGADAFTALASQGGGKSSRFLTEIEKRLTEDSCWPTRAKGEGRLVKASELVLPEHPALDGFLSDNRYLDPRLGKDAAVKAMAGKAGARPFTVSSLIRLRCAGDDPKPLATKLAKGVADFHYTDYAANLGREALQIRFGEALTTLSRNLANQHRTDLGATASTLSAARALKPAKSLVIVDTMIWDACPEPLESRLLPSLAPFRPISIHCRPFDEEQWMIDAAGRAATAADDDPEREALYAKLLSLDGPIARRALTPLRSNPVVRNQRGAWVAPAHMALLAGQVGTLLAPYVDTPSKAMLAAPRLMAGLRIRDTLNGADLVRFAQGVISRPEDAAAFEKLLADNFKLLTPQTVGRLRLLPCLRTRSGKFARPTSLHLDNQANRVCIGDDDKIVAAGNAMVHRRLGVREVPNADTLISAIKKARERKEGPARPDLIYPALVVALQRDGRDRTALFQDEICWVDADYHAPKDILVGPRHSWVLEQAIPIYKRADDVGTAFASLGAPTQAGPGHWARFFCHIAANWTAPLDTHRQRILIEAYHQRGGAGLPDGLDKVACLVDQQGRLFTHIDLTAGRLVEPDFPLLENALAENKSLIGLVVRMPRVQSFFTALGIRPLSAIAGAGKPIFGAAANAPFWFKLHHRDGLLAMLRKPIFGRALHEIARLQRHTHSDFTPTDQLSLRDRISAIDDIRFLLSIGRQYTVDGATVQVPVDVAVGDTAIGLVPPRTKLDFQMQLAEALAEIAGAKTVALARNLANAFLPLVLAPTSEAMRSHLERIGIDHARWGFDGDDDALADDGDFGETIGEEALRQMMHGLNMQGGGGDQNPPPQTSPQKPPLPILTVTPQAPPPLQLPAIDDVVLSVATTKGTLIEQRQQGGGGGGSYSGWTPRTPTEAARDAEVGRRGEELIYRLELERVRVLGHKNPEAVVVWTSLSEPGADHDIRSVDTDGNIKWIEVKSTRGIDGQFDWSRKEFEKAVRERERYELWRVYRAAEKAPVAKCFPNPAQLIGLSRIVLELGTMRANIEDVG